MANHQVVQNWPMPAVFGQCFIKEYICHSVLTEWHVAKAQPSMYQAVMEKILLAVQSPK